MVKCKYCEEESAEEYCNDTCKQAFVIKEKHLNRPAAEKKKSNTQIYEAQDNV